MPTLQQLRPGQATLAALARRNVLPSALSSAQQREQFGAAFHRLNFTSARTLAVDLITAYKDKVGKIINPVTVTREDGSLKTEGLDPATARLEIKQLQQELGIAKGDGSLKDITSNKRIDLVIKTNRDVIQGAGYFIQGNDPAVLDAYPARELIRIEEREQKRNWPARFSAAARIVGDTDALRILEEKGRMIARNDSPLWQALGEGAGGYESDALGNPFEPFAFGSGEGTRDVPYSECLDLELIKPGEKIEPQLPADLGDLLKEAA